MSDEAATMEAGEIGLKPIPLVVAADAPAPLPWWQRLPTLRFRVPRIVDYLIVAVFMWFVL